MPTSSSLSSFLKLKHFYYGKKWTYKRGENNVQSPRCPSSSFNISKLTAKLVSFIFLLTDFALSTIPISWSKFHLVCQFIHKHVHVCVLSHFSCVQLMATLWTVACQTPLSMGFSGQEYWSGLPCSPSRDLPDLGIELVPAGSPALAGGFFTTSPTWEAHINMYVSLKVRNFYFLEFLTITTIPFIITEEKSFDIVKYPISVHIFSVVSFFLHFIVCFNPDINKVHTLQLLLSIISLF